MEPPPPPELPMPRWLAGKTIKRKVQVKRGEEAADEVLCFTDGTLVRKSDYTELGRAGRFDASLSQVSQSVLFNLRCKIHGASVCCHHRRVHVSRLDEYMDVAAQWLFDTTVEEGHSNHCNKFPAPPAEGWSKPKPAS